MSAMTMTVIIPTYRRPRDLERCLNALKTQIRPADEILVVVRDRDLETWHFLDTFNADPLPLTTVTVSNPGVIAAMNCGLAAAKGDLIAFTDDDAAPFQDWLEKLESQFKMNEKVGAVGGRDILHGVKHIKAIEASVVGKVQWFGRIVGNHSFGVGSAREVDLLKGVNMSFRSEALMPVGFDERMRGTGAQVFFEDACCLTLKRSGWKIIYDPNIQVDHYPAQRFDEDQRRQFNQTAHVNKVHNETLNLLEHFSRLRRLVFLTWSTGVGTRNHRGIVQFLRFLPSEGLLSAQITYASFLGRWQGWKTWRKSLS